MDQLQRDAVAFIRNVKSFGSIDALTDQLWGVIEPFGFRTMFCMRVAQPGLPVRLSVLFGRPDRAWIMRYRDAGCTKHDPAVQRIFSSLTSFTWSDLRHDRLSSDQRYVFDLAAEHGYHDGFVVPVHGRHGDVSAVILTRETTERISPEDQATLDAAITLYALHGLTLHELAQDHPTTTPLTRRETECLAWAARGKSDWETSRILGISSSTVNAHVEGAKRKLGVSNRNQAVMAAWRHGWLFDTDS